MPWTLCFLPVFLYLQYQLFCGFIRLDPSAEMVQCDFLMRPPLLQRLWRHRFLLTQMLFLTLLTSRGDSKSGKTREQCKTENSREDCSTEPWPRRSSFLLLLIPTEESPKRGLTTPPGN